MPTYKSSKQQQKRQNLMNSALELFTEKGVVKTSVDDIVQRANIAKGTFYLYFHNKEQLLEQLIFNISQQVLTEAYLHMEPLRTDDFTANFLIVVDYIIEHFKKNRLMLRLIERNFSWPMVAKQITEETDPFTQKIIGELRQSPLAATHTEEEMFRTYFIVIEMIGSTCYSGIIENRPAPIDEMKPALYDMIRKIFA